MRAAGGVAAAVALALALVAGLPAPRERAAGRIELSTARGALAIRSSSEGSAILVARGLAPGQTRSGAVTIANRGGPIGHLFLESGRAPGAFARRVELRLRGGARGAVLLAGTPAALSGCHDLGALAAGELRSYRLEVAFPRGHGDNAYAGASASVDETWRAGACAATATLREPARLVISHRRVVVTRGRALVRVRCRGAAGARCAGTLGLVGARGTSRLSAAGDARLALPAGSSRAVALPLPAPLRRRLARTHKAIATARISPGGPVRRLTLILHA